MKYLWLFLLWAGTTMAQDYIQYYEYVNEAEYWMYRQEYNKATQLYLASESKAPILAKDAYLLAKCYAYQGDRDNCFKWLVKSAEYNITMAPYFLQKHSEWAVFKSIFLEDGELEALRQDLILIAKAEQKKQRDSIFTMLRDTVNVLFDQDQLLRNKGNYSAWTMQERRLFEKNDSIVQTALLDLTKKHGFPGYLKIGTDIIDLVLVHVDKHFYAEYKPLLLEEVRKGNLLPFGYGYMLDRFYWMYEHNQQENDCYLHMLYTRKICVEQDYYEVVQRRKSIGLSIYFSGPRKKPTESFKLLPWVNENFVEIHSLLHKINKK